MPLFARRRPERDLLASLTDHLGARPKLLAWAETSDGFVAGLADQMLLRDATGWHSHPWHTIATGKWDGASSQLAWMDTDGTEHSIELDGPGRFPDLFNERVSASVVFTRRVDLGGRRHATIALRRSLAADADDATWQVTPSPGVDLTDPDVSARIDQELAAVQSDFGIE